MQLDSLLDSYRSHAATQRDRGTAFEKLIAAWLVTDPVQSKRFARVEPWADWARRKGVDRTDVGIDLVGTLSGGGVARTTWRNSKSPISHSPQPRMPASWQPPWPRRTRARCAWCSPPTSRSR